VNESRQLLHSTIQQSTINNDSTIEVIKSTIDDLIIPSQIHSSVEVLHLIGVTVEGQRARRPEE
jgi:hypothetical protein